jgi:hypothetical protein
MAYITTAQLKAALDITGSSEDSVLSEYPARAKHFVDTYCHRTFEASSDATRRYTPLREDDGGQIMNDGITLMLDDDLFSLTSITNGDGTAIPTNAVILLPNNILPASFIRIKQTLGYVWTYTGAPEQSVVVTGRWAYSLNPHPDIVEAALTVAMTMYRALSGAPAIDYVTASAEGFEITPNKIPSKVYQILNAYRRRI